MYKINFEKPCRIYFIGIGGISMSGLAKILVNAGFIISGSDIKKSNLTEQLEQKGVTISYNQQSSNICKDKIDVVVYTAAIHEDHPELSEVIKLNIPRLTRAQLLGQTMQKYNTSIAISGTHGKTTTTSMITQIFLQAKKNPTVSVGGMLDCINGNFYLGSQELFIVEACEYQNSFLEFYPTAAAVLNIEMDHPDFFKDINDVRNSFRAFMETLPQNGLLVINNEIDNIEELTADVSSKIITFGIEGETADYVAENITYTQQHKTTFSVLHKSFKIADISLNSVGIHNVKNAMASIAIAFELGVDVQTIKSGLMQFHNAHRRFEYKGTFSDMIVIDDYSHHPQEIEAALHVANIVKNGKVIVAFQPHTYTRTKALLDEFAKSLSCADIVLLAPIYAAREHDDLGVSSDDICKLINKDTEKAYNFSSFEEIENWIITNCDSNDIIITMGAGDIYKVGEDLLKKYATGDLSF